MRSTGLMFKSRDYIGPVEPPATVLEDESRWGNNGTFLAADNPDWVQLPSGLWVMDFDGSDHVDITDSLTPMASNKTGTWLICVKPDDATPATYEALISFGDTDANEFIVLSVHPDGYLNAACNAGGAGKWTLLTSAVAFSNNTWALVGITHNGIQPTLYVNGVAPAQSFSAEADKTVWFAGATGLDNGFLGKVSSYNAPNQVYLNGCLVCFKMYNYVLPAEVMAAIFQAERHWFGV